MNRPAKRYFWMLGLLFGVAVPGASCAPEGPSTDSKSNWFRSCSTEADCSDDLSCLCGVCSLACTQDAECTEDRPARCLEPEDYAQCATPNGPSCRPTCEVSEDCDTGQECLGNVCIAQDIALPGYCDGVLDASDEDVEFELMIVDRINRQRTLGTECLVTDFVPAAPLVLDYRLRCAGRVHAQEMVELGYYDEDSPDGTTPGDRMADAGYPVVEWSIIIADGRSDETVTQAMTDFCVWLSDPDLTDIGVGVTGTRISINLAGQ